MFVRVRDDLAYICYVCKEPKYVKHEVCQRSLTQIYHNKFSHMLEGEVLVCGSNCGIKLPTPLFRLRFTYSCVDMFLTEIKDTTKMVTGPLIYNIRNGYVIAFDSFGFLETGEMRTDVLLRSSNFEKYIPLFDIDKSLFDILIHKYENLLIPSS